MHYIDGIAVFGSTDDKTLAQAKDVAARAVRVALMSDNHLGYIMPIGGVAAYDNQVSVAGVGFDIACGNCAIRTDRRMSDLKPIDTTWLTQIADEIAATISFGVGRTNKADDAPVDHPLFESDAWSLIPDKHERDRLKAKAREQLGTVGSGNHYVDVFVDENGYLWVGVHFGSRGLGHTIASGFMALAQNEKWGTKVKEVEGLLSLDTPLGHDYWHLMELAGQYAYAGREWVARKVVEILGGQEVELVHNHHNYAWKEEHLLPAELSATGTRGATSLSIPREAVVVRKGATPAFPDQYGFVGGSMGDQSVILRGTRPELADDDEEFYDRFLLQRDALYSTVHGAGRVMSRTEARGKTKGWGKNKRVVAPGKVSQQMLDEWIEREGVILRGGGLDEAPHAYRRLPDVLASQGPTIEVVHTLQPMIVVMAGENEYDPFKD